FLYTLSDFFNSVLRLQTGIGSAGCNGLHVMRERVNLFTLLQHERFHSRNTRMNIKKRHEDDFLPLWPMR
ncbi:MAG TPA: hypothetical protein DD401_04550, partial [Prevotella sp.]|nr:hypothetical protein [Prevotella sp.]